MNSKKITERKLLVTSLAERVRQSAKSNDQNLERLCWVIVHEHKHGHAPTEYDIREIDEDLYLEVLRESKKGNQDASNL